MRRKQTAPAARVHRSVALEPSWADWISPDGAAKVVPPTAPHEDAEARHAKIARLAYSFWEQRGCPEGSPWEDWSRAEAEIDR